MTVLVLPPARRDLARGGGGAGGCRCRSMPRYDEPDPPGAERIVDFALCLILAVAVIGLLLLAL